MPRAPDLKNRVIRLLMDGPRTWDELKRETGASDSSLGYALRSLQENNLVEKSGDRWFLKKEGFTKELLRRSVEDSFQSYEAVCVMEYGSLLLDPEVPELLKHEFRKAFQDLVWSYAAYVYALYFGWLAGSDGLRESVTALGYITLLGGLEMGLNPEDLASLDDQVLNDCVLVGWSKVFNRTDPFILALWDLEVLAKFARIALGALDHIEAAKNKSMLMDQVRRFSPQLKALFDRIKSLKLMGIISFDEKSYDKKLLLVWRFEKWFEALKEGSLDHRKYLFSEENIKKLRLMIEDVRTGAIKKDILNAKIDKWEPWSLKDIYLNHPRGKDPQLYSEIKAELEKRCGGGITSTGEAPKWSWRELADKLRKLHLMRRKLEQSMLEASFKIRNKLRPEALEKICQALGYRKPEGTFLEYSELLERLKKNTRGGKRFGER